MAPNSWEISKHCCMFEGVRRRSRDIISELPEELLLQILSSIPTQDVVNTSTLSKRWRTLWTLVDAVEIDDLDLNFSENEAGFMNYVDNVLNQMVFVRKLGLNCYYFYDMSRIKQWIDIVISKLDDNGVLNELDLKFHLNQFVELPPRIFTCKKLVILKLIYMVINVPSSSSMAAWLPSLKVIHFNSVSILDVSSVENILAGCPVLEELSLRGFMRIKWKRKKTLCVKSSSLKRLTLHNFPGDGIINIEIEAPNLEELDVSFNLKSRIVISNTNLPLLKRLKYEIFENAVSDFYENAVREFLRKTSNIKYLFLCADAIICFKYSCFLRVLPVFKNLMHLKLDIVIYYLPLLYSLLKLSPNLVSFVLYSNDSELISPPNQFRTPDNNGLMLEFLETVELIDFRGRYQEMDLVTYFLKNAPVLKKMTILFKSEEDGHFIQILKKMTILFKSEEDDHFIQIILFKSEKARLYRRIVELPKTSMACQVIYKTLSDFTIDFDSIHVEEDSYSDSDWIGFDY